MRWEGGRRSTNIEDRRGIGMGTIGGGGIGMLLLILTVSCLTGTNPLALLQMVEETQPAQTQSVPTGAPTKSVSAVCAMRARVMSSSSNCSRLRRARSRLISSAALDDKRERLSSRKHDNGPL